MGPGPLPLPLVMSPAQEAALTALLRRSSCPQALALRVKILLGAVADQRNEPLARAVGCTPTTVRKWRGRWHAAAARLAAVDDDPAALAQTIAAILADAPRPGAPGTFTADQIVRIVNLACCPPEQSGRPVTAWTPRELADEAAKQGIVVTISPRTVGRFLAVLRPARAGGLHRCCLWLPAAGGLYPLGCFNPRTATGRHDRPYQPC